MNPKNSLAIQRTQHVEFYDRFLKILKRHEIHQAPTQTAREFVQSALHELEPKLTEHGLQSWPDDLVAKFYDVRFGGLELREFEAQEIDSRLVELEACLAEPEEVVQ